MAEFFETLFHRKTKDKPQEIKTEEVRQSDPYRRLKSKFVDGGVNVRSGFEKDSLTVGDLVDILHLYLLSVNTNATGEHIPIARAIHATIPITTPQEQEELDKLGKPSIGPKDLDRTNSLYSRTMDLSEAIKTDPIEQSQFELCHFPGGMVIEPTPGSAEKYSLRLTNRQVTKEELSKQLLTEVGLPAK